LKDRFIHAYRTKLGLLKQAISRATGKLTYIKQTAVDPGDRKISNGRKNKQDRKQSKENKQQANMSPPKLSSMPLSSRRLPAPANWRPRSCARLLEVWALP